MNRISVCIDMMFSYCALYDRIDEVKRCGFETIEFWKWTNKDINKIASLLNETGIGLSVFNLDSKDEMLSYDLSRGILNSGREKDFLRALHESLPVYKLLGASGLIVLIGEHEPYNETNCLKCLQAAKPFIEEEGVNLLIEPLNSIDRPGYSMPYADPVFRLLEKADSPNIKMLYDMYHQSMTGDFLNTADKVKHLGRTS